MRKITVYSTKNSNLLSFESDAQTWGVLRGELIEKGYDLHNLQATENVNKTTLINEDAAVPNQDVVIFLRPIETKQGCLPRAEIYEIIKSDEELRAFIKENVGNYTQTSSAELERLINDFRDMNENTCDKSGIDVFDINESIDELDIDELIDTEYIEETIQKVCEKNVGNSCNHDVNKIHSLVEKMTKELNSIQESINGIRTLLEFPELEKEARKLERTMLQ